LDKKGSQSIVPKSLEISQDVSLAEGPWRKGDTAVARSFEISSDMTEVETTRREDGWKESGTTATEISELGMFTEPATVKTAEKRKRLPTQRPTRERTFRKSMTKHVRGIKLNKLDDQWLGAVRHKGFDEQTHLRYEVSVEGSKPSQTKIYAGPESGVRFNHNRYHGTWSTPSAAAAGYSSRVVPKNLEFLKKGTSSLIEVNEDEVSVFVEDTLLRLLVRFPGARKSLCESIRISEASGSEGVVHWSKPEKKWLFKCLVDEHGEIPPDTEGILSVRQYLANRPDVFPGALKTVTATQAVESAPSLDWNDEDGAVTEAIPRNPSATTANSVATPQKRKVTTAGEGVPAIGEEWSDFAQMEGYVHGMFHDEGTEAPEPGTALSNSFTISDDYLDSIPAAEIPDVPDVERSLEDSTEDASDLDDPSIIVPERVNQSSENETDDFLEADFVASEASSSLDDGDVIEGSLDYFFVDEVQDFDMFLEGNSDESLGDSANSHNKANWAVQDLYTMLQTTSVLQRIQAGRRFLLEKHGQNATDHNFLREPPGESYVQNLTSFRKSNDGSIRMSNIMTVQELAEYCSPESTNGGLRHDLQHVRTLITSNERAKNRIYSLIHAEFSDQMVHSRGYSWLVNVLHFNQRRIDQWSEMIQSKEGFRHSDERVDELEDVVASDWNELSDDSEMWEWNKNVDTNHASLIAERITEDDRSETADDLLERIEEEWGYVFDEDEEELVDKE